MTGLRSRFRAVVYLSLMLTVLAAGCRFKTKATVMKTDKKDHIGSDTAGAETWKPLVDTALQNLLARQEAGIQQTSGGESFPLRIVFVGVENRSSEELGDFKEQIQEHIDTYLRSSRAFKPVSKKFVDAGLRECRLRPDDLFVPRNMRAFTAVMEQQGYPVDCLVFAKITSGTTNDGKDYQRDYMLTIESVNVVTGDEDKESATLRKYYNRRGFLK